MLFAYCPDFSVCVSSRKRELVFCIHSQSVDTPSNGSVVVQCITCLPKLTEDLVVFSRQKYHIRNYRRQIMGT